MLRYHDLLSVRHHDLHISGHPVDVQRRNVFSGNTDLSPRVAAVKCIAVMPFPAVIIGIAQIADPSPHQDSHHGDTQAKAHQHCRHDQRDLY